MPSRRAREARLIEHDKLPAVAGGTDTSQHISVIAVWAQLRNQGIELPPFQWLNHIVGIKPESVIARGMVQGDISRGRKIVDPGEIDHAGTESNRDFPCAVRAAGINNYDVIEKAANRFQTNRQIAFLIANNHCQADLGFTHLLSHSQCLIGRDTAIKQKGGYFKRRQQSSWMWNPRFNRSRLTGTERKPERGERSQGRWRGGSPWLHKRGFGSAEAREGPRRCRRESLTPRGIHPLSVVLSFARESERGRPPSAGPQRSGARKLLGRPDGDGLEMIEGMERFWLLNGLTVGHGGRKPEDG